ncbi:MAG: AgmX/PglI C-terminal domain-containing protein [Sandaracinus sp.]
MSFCSSCGAQNSDDARFCNKCGTPIQAAPGASAPAPSGGTTTGSGKTGAGATGAGSTGTVTLGGIGIQSQGRTYAVLAAGALAFLALGAGVTYLFLHGSAPPAVATAETTEPGSGTGDPSAPDGVDVPDDDFVMTSGAHVVHRDDGTTGGTGSGTTPPTTQTGSTGGGAAHPDAPRPTGAHTGGTRPTSTGSGTGTGSGTSTGTGSGTSTGTGSGTSTGTGSGTSTGTGSGTSTGTGSGTSTGTGSGTSTGTGTGTGTTPDWGSMQDTVAAEGEEPDYQMQMYSTQVRRFIRQYLLPQATSCFEHASATSRDPVRGTVAIGFDIDARGHAQGASIDRNTTGNEQLARCLQNNVNTWQLPPPPEGTAPIQMQMPFTR